MSKKFKKDVGAIVHSRGVTFRVWAPFADSVAVTGTFNNWQETPLESELDGYWSAMVRHVEAGHEYKYVIYNGDKRLVRNDPRAKQLTADAGTGIIVDPSFDWGDDSFTPPPKDQMIIYEMHVGSFHRPDASSEGTFYNAIEKLDHLSALGVNMIELMPIGIMPGDHGWGYAPDYIYAVENNYGGRHGLLEFIKAAHAKGIGVILDVVYNHLGPGGNLDLWQFDGWSENNLGGIYFYNDWRAKTPWSHGRPDFGRVEVRQYLLDNVRYWLFDCHFDGLRVDSTLFMRNVYGRHNDPSTDLPEAWSFMQDLNDIAKKINPNSLIIGEDVAENDYITKPHNQGGAGFDSQWQVTMPYAFRQALSHNKTSEIVLEQLLGELGRTYNGDPWQRVVYVDSHDSAANGAQRLNEQVDPGKPTSPKALRRSLIGAGILLTVPGIPMLLQGQEFAQGGDFNDWHGLDWSQVDKMPGYLEAYKHLLALRKNQHGISRGLVGAGLNVIHVNDQDKVIAYHRWADGGPKDDVMVIANFAKRHHKQYDLGFPRNGLWRVRFNSTWKGYHPSFKDVPVSDVSVNSGQGTIELPPSSILILSQDD